MQRDGRIATRRRQKFIPLLLFVPIAYYVWLSLYSLPLKLPRHDHSEQYKDAPALPAGFIPRKKIVPVLSGDYISQPGYDLSPIVIEKYKLIFFTNPVVACTEWKQLFRRIMGFEDWWDPSVDHHNPNTNGLVYLRDYSLEEATRLMNSPDYTRAMFVRDPKERLVSAFLEKAFNGFVKANCCQGSINCEKEAQSSLANFVTMTRGCGEPHWRPQGERMDPKFFDTLDFVGHLETSTVNAKALLKRIGAWGNFGKSGWGQDGDESIFASKSAVHHATSNYRLNKYFTKELEEQVEMIYYSDYHIPQLNLTMKKIEFLPQQDAHHPSLVSVLSTDYISRPAYDSSPIVIEKYKLIFFTTPKVGCTVWKQLFRRIMGFDDWWDPTVDHHNPKTNGLVYLRDYSLEEATRLMNSPDYTRAMFVRDPKERLVSAFLDKAFSGYLKTDCCKGSIICEKRAQSSLANFVTMTRGCNDPHWRPQGRRLDPKFFGTLDFVGHMETSTVNAKALLKRIGAWGSFGKSGWGQDGDESIFASKSAVFHATSEGRKDSSSRLRDYFTEDLEQAVEIIYYSDYHIPQLNLTMKKIEFLPQ
jgi:hypothetical protein